MYLVFSYVFIVLSILVMLNGLHFLLFINSVVKRMPCVLEYESTINIQWHH